MINFGAFQLAHRNLVRICRTRISAACIDIADIVGGLRGHILSNYTVLGKRSNTTLRILSVRGVPPPLYGQNFRQKKVTDLGGTPLPPFTDIPPKNVLQKVLKMVFFAQKTPVFGPKIRLRIWGVPLPPPLRTKFSARKGLRIWGVPPLPLYGQNLQSSI